LISATSGFEKLNVMLSVAFAIATPCGSMVAVGVNSAESPTGTVNEVGSDPRETDV